MCWPAGREPSSCTCAASPAPRLGPRAGVCTRTTSPCLAWVSVSSREAAQGPSPCSPSRRSQQGATCGPPPRSRHPTETVVHGIALVDTWVGVGERRHVSESCAIATLVGFELPPERVAPSDLVSALWHSEHRHVSWLHSSEPVRSSLYVSAC